MSKTLVINGWMGFCDRYDRMQQVVLLKPGSSKVKAFTCNFVANGATFPFGADLTLTLNLDGKPVATAAVSATDLNVTFDVDITAIPEGWYTASVTGLDSSWSALDYGVYVLKGATAQPSTWMPVTTASHEMIFDGKGKYQSTWVPAKFAPVTVPYPSREFPDLTTVPARKDVVITSLAVPRPGDLYRPAITKEGVLTTANRENYFYYDFEQPKPILPMLDGPRGRGSIISPVHLEVGSAAPNGALRGNVYFIESWRIGKVSPDGTVTTLAGYRHKDMASYWNDPTSAELVGDWSSIPPERRGFAQPWGMAWDPRTLTINTGAPPIPSEGNEQPHVLGPTLYVSDTYRNRVVKIAYSAVAHGIPPKITEFATGLNEPWDVVIEGTQLYVSDRMNNAIKVFDIDSGALVKTIPVIQPEGMAKQDGWLYYASVKSKSIRKMNLVTGSDVLVTDPNVAGSNMGYYINGNSRFMKIAISDGTFGPRGMLAYTTWSNSYYGYPVLIDGATGKMIDWLVTNGAAVKGTTPPLGSYSSAVGIGFGRMLFGTAEEGLHVASKALPSDVTIDATKYNAGRDQWQAKGFGLTHGPAGYGYYGYALPWGNSPEIDYFLTQNLHTPSGTPAGGASPFVGASPSVLNFAATTVGQTSAVQTITVSNTGNAAATNMVFPAAPASFNKAGTCSGTTLNAGASCTVAFMYAPTATGADNAIFTITGGGSTIPIQISGTGIAASGGGGGGGGAGGTTSPSLSAAPSSLAFGNVTVGQPSAAKSVTVTNSGTAAASGMSLANSNAVEFAVSGNTCGTSLAAGASCSLNVTYTPAASGADGATVTFSYTGGSTQVTASGTGTAAASASLSVSSATLAFGTVTIGQTAASKSVTITNTGGAAAGSLSLSNSSAGEFPVSGNTCGASLAPAASCSLSVAYTPADTGTDNAALMFSFNGGTAQVALSGTGAAVVAAAVAATPTSLAFGNVATGKTSAAQTITVTNTGSAAATNMAYPAAPAKYSKSGTCSSTTLNAGASCTVVLTYSPTAAGTDSATYTITGGGSTMTVSLSGTGTAATNASLSANPPVLAFGNVTGGQSSSAQVVLVTNTGGASANALALSSNNAAKFAVSNNGCGTLLAAGASCTYHVTYTPTGNGSDSGTVTLSYTGGSVKVSVSGTGISQPTPQLTAQPAVISFGNVTINTISGIRTVLVRNAGSATATGLSIANGNATRFPLTANTCGTTLAAGATCVVSATYAPSQGVTDSAVLTINSAGVSPIVVPLIGTGITAASPTLTATPPLAAFGSVNVGSSSTPMAISVSNKGKAAATALTLVNSNSAEYVVTGNTCGTSLNAGATCGMSVTYKPTSAGNDYATLTWTYSGGGALLVSLSGTGVTAATPASTGQLSMPASVNLSTQVLGTASPKQTVTVGNVGTSPVAVSAITSSSAGEFAVSGSTCTTVNPGATCKFNVTFAPFQIGARSATIKLVSNGIASPQTMLALGIGASGAPTRSPPAGGAAAVEYYHAAFDHYFVTAIDGEIAKLDNGTFAGWERTGKQFNVLGDKSSGQVVCRFFSTAFGEKSSHFYTPVGAECATVQANPDWQFEGEVFLTVAPAMDGSCGTGMVPVYRVYNNGNGGAPNHRYTTDLSIRDMMLSQGWIAEGYGDDGVIMCSAQ